jgi:hypothetical protein
MAVLSDEGSAVMTTLGVEFKKSHFSREQRKHLRILYGFF